MKLLPMTDFIIRLNQNPNYIDENGNTPFFHTAINHFQNSNRSEDYRCVIRYANFLKQPLNKGMFVPCDLEGNVLSRPHAPWQDSIEHEGLHNLYKTKIKQYKQAEERVLFKDVELVSNSESAYVFKVGDFEFAFGDTKPYSIILCKKRSICTIEQLANFCSDYDIDIELTESAIKQFM